MPKQLSEKLQFRSFGLEIGLESDDPNLLARALKQAKRSLLNKLEIVEYESPERVIGLYSDDDGVFVLRHRGADERFTNDPEYFLEYFEMWLRLTVAEYAKNRVFLHSGAVGWRDKGIIFPGASFAGKSTLTEAFVRAGATYYSDEYAILDENACLHPFPRPISLRMGSIENGIREVREFDVTELDLPIGVRPIPIKCVLITRYDPDCLWEPRFTTPGDAMLELVSHTIPIRYDPKFSLKVLKSLVSNAILVKSDRNDVGRFVNEFLNFFDNSGY